MISSFLFFLLTDESIYQSVYEKTSDIVTVSKKKKIEGTSPLIIRGEGIHMGGS